MFLDIVLIYWQRQMNGAGHITLYIYIYIYMILLGLIHTSHKCVLNYARVAFIMFTRVTYTVICARETE